MRARPNEPQSRRDLANVLARRSFDNLTGQQVNKAACTADLVRAVELMLDVITTPPDLRFAEIEVVALTELNNWVARAARLQLPIPVNLVNGYWQR